MKGDALLKHAAGIGTRRRRDYGDPTALFEQIAERRSLTLGIDVSAAPAFAYMIDVKLARLAHDRGNADSVANIDTLRALPILCIPGNGRDADMGERQLAAGRRVLKSIEKLGGIGSLTVSALWHVVGLQESVRQWAHRSG